jgi:hypothetical protein
MWDARDDEPGGSFIVVLTGENKVASEVTIQWTQASALGMDLFRA